MKAQLLLRNAPEDELPVLDLFNAAWTDLPSGPHCFVLAVTMRSSTNADSILTYSYKVLPP